MNTTFKLFTLLLFITLSSCDSTKKIDYKYADSPKALACDFDNGDLYKEAIYSFENDIMNNYDANSKSVSKSYAIFIGNIMRKDINMEDIASEHSLKIAQALKNETDLWSTKNGNTSLNYSHPLVDCMVNNIKDTSVKQTMNALLSTNSMRPKIILPTLYSVARGMQGDGNLKSYLAFDFYFSKLLNSKLENLKNPNPEHALEQPKPTVNGVNINKTQNATTTIKKASEDAHAGHNHD